MGDHRQQSPRIRHISWGRIDVEGVGSGKDFKLYPGGGRGWDWNETGTRHVPGIQPADVQELLDRGATVVVLSRGMQLVLQTCPETLRLLAEKGIAVHVTNRAIIEQIEADFADPRDAGNRHDIFGRAAGHYL